MRLVTIKEKKGKSCDLYGVRKEVVDGLDLGVFVGNWLEGL